MYLMMLFRSLRHGVMLLNVEIINQGRDNLAHGKGPAVIEEKMMTN